MKHLTVILLFLTISSTSLACSCINRTLSERYETSTFVGVVRITGFESVIMNGKSTNVFNVETLQTFKGENAPTIYSYNTGCSFYGKINSKWLIFTYLNDDGVLLTGYCSGNIDINPTLDEDKYPNLKEKLSKKLKTKLSVLEFPQKKKITTLDPYGLWLGKNRAEKAKPWEGFVEDNTFAVYEQTLNEHLEVIKVKPLKKFKNRDLSKRILAGMKTQTYVYRRDCSKDVINKGKIIVVLYYYPAEGKYQSFISTNDL